MESVGYGQDIGDDGTETLAEWTIDSDGVNHVKIVRLEAKHTQGGPVPLFDRLDLAGILEGAENRRDQAVEDLVAEVYRMHQALKDSPCTCTIDRRCSRCDVLDA